MFCKIRWILFHVDHGSSFLEWVIWVTLWSIQCNTFIAVELSSELIAVNNSKYTSIDIQVDSKIEVFPLIMGSCIVWSRYFVAFQKHTLRDPTVLNLSFNDVEGIVIQVVVYNTLSNPKVFVGIFNDWFLEVCVELEDLFMKDKFDKYNKLNHEIPTCLSYLSHLGAIFGIASFSEGLLR